MFLSERPCLIISYGQFPQVIQLTGVDTIINTYHAMDNFSKRQSDNILLIFFFQKTDFDITCKFVSAGDNLPEISKSVFWENK